MTDADPRWLAVQIKANSAQIAERNLRRQGYDVLMPMIERDLRRESRFVAARQPLFPGYAFVALGAGQASHPINSTLGVSRIVSFAGRPAFVPAGFVAALQARLAAGADAAAPPDLVTGDLITILRGPFADMIARVERLPALGRVAALLDFLGQASRIELPLSDVIKTGPSETGG